MLLFMSVSGPLELVLEVFAVLLKTLESPESSPTVLQMGSGGPAQLGTVLLKNASSRGHRALSMWVACHSCPIACPAHSRS